jgi:hypothetical protein
MINVVNLTPHPLRIKRGDGTFLELPKPAPGVAIPRRSVKTELVYSMESHDGSLPVYRTVLGPVENVPVDTPETVYVVSRIVVDALPDRTDLFSPGEAIRDAEGKVIGANGISR